MSVASEHTNELIGSTAETVAFPASVETVALPAEDKASVETVSFKEEQADKRSEETVAIANQTNALTERDILGANIVAAMTGGALWNT
jgi:hypothetical protein